MPTESKRLSSHITSEHEAEVRSPTSAFYQHLVSRPHPWRRQLYVSGRKLRAFTVWLDMQTNSLTAHEAAESWDLPLEAVTESIEYCESHRDLTEMEAREERRRLVEKGYSLVPPNQSPM